MIQSQNARFKSIERMTIVYRGHNMRPKFGSEDNEEVKIEKLKEVLGFQIFLSRIEEGRKLSKMERSSIA